MVDEPEDDITITVDLTRVEKTGPGRFTYHLPQPISFDLASDWRVGLVHASFPASLNNSHNCAVFVTNTTTQSTVRVGLTSKAYHSQSTFTTELTEIFSGLKQFCQTEGHSPYLINYDNRVNRFSISSIVNDAVFELRLSEELAPKLGFDKGLVTFSEATGRVRSQHPPNFYYGHEYVLINVDCVAPRLFLDKYVSLLEIYPISLTSRQNIGYEQPYFASQVKDNYGKKILFYPLSRTPLHDITFELTSERLQPIEWYPSDPGSVILTLSFTRRRRTLFL